MNLLKHNLMLLTMISSLTIMNLFSLEEENHHQQAEAKLIIGQLDEALSEIALNFPDNMTQEDVNTSLAATFNLFYKFITSAKPKGLTSTLVLFIQYCELICQHGKTSKIIATMDLQQRELLFASFFLAWENLLTGAVDQLKDSIHNVFINIPQPS